ncbi:hypothetical protein KP509_10G023600 [Ceratopteris richardii]|uniref:Cation/H+ exchanger transmembrane domain-containing protein n=1 Tax=Ceratopteris richardii TaxID=49495 RepID=A0A8T2TZ67_CERRI|nr:hypothetical protein KP509_10G023600 [Ceratopteris richardii]
MADFRTLRAQGPFLRHGDSCKACPAYAQRWEYVCFYKSPPMVRHPQCYIASKDSVHCYMTQLCSRIARNSEPGTKNPIFFNYGGFRVHKKPNFLLGAKYKSINYRQVMVRAEMSLAAGLDVINDLGLDTLTFLVATVLVVPSFKAVKASPILGFFLSGVVMNQLGLIRNLLDVKALSELGILFLLFEMGLELSLARLRALAKFAFGMGLAQVCFCTLAFTAFELPPNGAIGTKILEFLFHSRPDLVNIRTVDEAIVIGAALSMSSSAFVLQVSPPHHI